MSGNRSKFIKQIIYETWDECRFTALTCDPTFQIQDPGSQNLLFFGIYLHKEDFATPMFCMEAASADAEGMRTLCLDFLLVPTA